MAMPLARMNDWFCRIVRAMAARKSRLPRLAGSGVGHSPGPSPPAGSATPITTVTTSIGSWRG
jgi:hypothetical protein